MMFGNVNIFLPKLKDRLMSNDKVRDIMSTTSEPEYDSDKAQEDFAKEYDEYTIKSVKVKKKY